MDRRSFLRKALGASAGVGAVVLGAKNLGSPSTGDRKEVADEFDDVTYDPKWGTSVLERMYYSNPPYVWGTYPETVRVSARPADVLRSEVEWSDGVTTHHIGIAQRHYDPGDGRMHLLMSNDGKEWLDVDASARLQAATTAWEWQPRDRTVHYISYDFGRLPMSYHTPEPPTDVLAHLRAGRAKYAMANNQWEALHIRSIPSYRRTVDV